MGEVRDVSLALSEMQSELTGCIRVSVPFGFGTDWVASLLARFAVKYPRIELFVQATHKWVDVSKESFDVAISIGRVHNKNLPAVQLGELTRGVYASPDYCRDHGIPSDPADLVNFARIPIDTQIEDGYWTFKQDGKVVPPAPELQRITVTDVNVARHMALAGLGYAILPNMICRQMCREGRLQRVLADWPIPPVLVIATYVERRYMPRRVRLLLDFIAEMLDPKLPRPEI